MNENDAKKELFELITRAEQRLWGEDIAGLQAKRQMVANYLVCHGATVKDEKYMELVKRDMPYVPKPDHKYFGKGVCKCGAVFMDKATKFCGNCGQRLDWKEGKK